jgi:nucleoside-diphosphate-sugar epimerase
MHRILITGATGFVGSSLAATFLSTNAHVVAVSRNDPAGARTLSAVKAAAEGNGLDIGTALATRFETINVDFDNLEAHLPSASLAEITEVWHVAAEMSYSPHKLSQSFAANVGNTSRLYERVLKYAPSCRRFYHVSTAYVAGMAGGVVREQMHAWSALVNPYQVTKWGAEQALNLLHHRHGLPVTVFRPTIVIGNRRTCWAHRNGLGFYMFLDAMAAVARAGHKELAVDLVGSTRPDLVSIDQLMEDAAALVRRGASSNNFEVFHSSGGLQVCVEELVSIWGDSVGVLATIGAPATVVEQQFDRGVERNRSFACTEWAFERDKLNAAIGRDTSPKPLTPAELRRLCHWYANTSVSRASAMPADVT